MHQYYGLISGRGIKGEIPFFNMASMELDLLTVKNIGKHKGPLSDPIDVRRGLKALCALHYPKVSVSDDGQLVIERETGTLSI